MTDSKTTVNGQPFLGRLEEQEKFRNALRSVQAERSLINKIKDWATEKKSLFPFVFLLYGEGGMGKTYLSKRLRDIAESEQGFAGLFNILWLDWEKRKELDYALKVRDAVNAEKVLEHLYSLFRDNNYGLNFTEYENAIVTREKAVSKIAQALEKSSERGERFKTLKELGGKGVAWLIRSGIVGGISIPVPEEPTAKLFEEIISNGAEAIDRIREAANSFVRATLDSREFDLFILPNEKLAHSLAAGIRTSSSEKAIVLILDTYEISDRVDVWMREVIKRSGPHVIWVISGRDNLADSRKFGTRYFNGYSDDFPLDRLRVFPLSEFSNDEVFNYLAEYVPERQINSGAVEKIHQATFGIPLAVQAAAYMWKAGTRLEDIVSNVPETKKRDVIVKLMTERFLLHCFDDPMNPADLYNIYALALAYGPDPGLLRSILNNENLEYALSELERRHSFVFLDQMKLHSSVQTFLREYLLHPVRRSSVDVKSINTRAVAYLDEVSVRRESSLRLLEKLIDDDVWKETKLGLIHHSFWLDSETGWKIFAPAFVAGLMYDIDFARACLEIIDSIYEMLRRPEKQRFDVIRKGLRPGSKPDDRIEMLDRLQKIIQGQTDHLFEKEVLACLAILWGESLNSLKQYIASFDKYLIAEGNLSAENNKLEVKLGDALFELSQTIFGANMLLKDKWSQTKLIEIVEKGIIHMQAKWRGYEQLGACLIRFNRYEDAEIALEKAIQLNATYAEPYYDLAMIYRNRRDIDAAIRFCQQALEIDSNLYGAHNGLGYLLIQKGDYDLAKKHLIKCTEDGEGLPEPFINLGIVYMIKGETKLAEGAFEEAINNADQNSPLSIGSKGWAEVILGRFESGLKHMKEALDRSDFIRNVQNFYDWTITISRVANSSLPVQKLLEFIENETAFRDLKKN